MLKLNMYSGMLKGMSMITVFATGEMSARVSIYDQLNRQGRKLILKRWVEEGCVVVPRFKK
jgi:hypothetical protein